MPKAVSKAQKIMMGIVHAAQTGQLPKRKLNSTGRRVARTIQPVHSKEFADTPEPPELPYYKDGSGPGSRKKNGSKKVNKAATADEKGTASAKKASAAKKKPAAKKASTAKKKPTTRKASATKKKPAAKKVSTAKKKPATRKRGGTVKEHLLEGFFDRMHTTKSVQEQPRPKMTPEMRDRFLRVVAEYNRFGKILNRSGSLTELSRKLMALAELAEYVVLEQSDDFFDNHTIRRNFKEMKSYVKEFSKNAHNADMLNQRIIALYEDMGRILERYFEVYDITEKNDVEDRMNAIHEVRSSKVPLLIEGVRVDPYSAKVYTAVSKVMGEKLHSLPLREAIQTAWRLIK
jgi:alkylhydroperoxidase/carboxymuconolactone decarboxylase family protein YurZ